MEDRKNSILDEKEEKNDDIRIPDQVAENGTTLPVSSRAVFHSGTYVVQVPKDQIYRVPPPENAIMLEQRNLKNQDKQKRSSCCCFCSCHSCIFKLFRGNKSG
ncbi:hypothetical protein ABFS82_14G274700 [Erythranthe guttata]|uniref:uncharacterized protein LOC105958784 n=1 Tax=Erythranthe guttata TaxID=4155 RepID=UPI00064D9322|nr:PREDICTED: uncharacterized protein LOC105958784 [Erythranthe guttata]|eukprot:XP_012838241.1 PREDICTED: uncharacterized protein LOC105958784 [Erythranthe guttata]